MGKRFDAEMFVDETAGARHARLRLPAHDRHGDGAGAGLPFANWEQGYGDFHLVPDLGTLRVASWLEKTALVLCDVEDERDATSYVAVAPRSMLRRQVDAARDAGLHGIARRPSSSTTCSSTSYREAAQQGYRDLEPAGWYLEDYHILQGTRTEGFTPRCAAI